MNFLHILRRFIFIFFAFRYSIFLIPAFPAPNFPESGHPYIQTCISGAYSWVDRYNSIVQNDEGFIFIGARNGILRFEGSSWKYMPSKGDLHLVHHGGGIIGYSKDRLGHLSRAPGGELVMTDGMPATGALRGNLLQVLSVDKNIYILSSQGLYVMREGTPLEIKTEITVVRIIPYGNGIFLASEGNALYVLSGEQLQKADLPGGTGRQSRILSIDNQTLFIQGKDKTHILWGPSDSVTVFRPTGSFPGSYDLTCAARLGGGQLAFGTSGNGIVITSLNGEIITRITISEGLYGNDIVQLLADPAGNLWALHEQAVSRIEIPSAFSQFNLENGLEGDVKDVLRHRGVLYAVSSQGLFRLQVRKDPGDPFPGTARFSKVSGIGGDCRCLASAGDWLIVGGNGGLYEISGELVRMILPDPVNVVHYEPGNNILLAGTETGLRMFHLTDREEIRNFSFPNVSVDKIVHLNSGILWLSSRSGALYQSTRPLSEEGNLDYASYTSDDLQSINGSYIDLVDFSGNLYFSSSKGLFRHDPGKGNFFPDTVFRFPLRKGSYRVKQITRDTEETIWISIDDPDGNVQKLWRGRLSGDGNCSLQPLTYRRLDNRIINCIYPDQGNVIWIGTQEGLLRYDPGFTRPAPPPSQTHINRVSIGTEPAARYDAPDGVKIPHSRNHIRFDFLSADYNCESSALFQYRLAGLNEQWSEWTDDPYAEFNRLGEGNYEFQVRSQDIYGVVSLPDTFRFRIRAPFYAAWYAFIIYSICFLLILYLVQKWRRLQQMRAQYHLEEVVQQRTESIIKEKDKAEDLIANILPKTTADELKARGKVTSRKFRMVTVLFADIQGFTKIAEHMNPDKLIDQLDRFYFHFDSVVEKYNIEKIKTIGDAYMAAGGIPIKNRTNPVDVVLAALEMQQYMKELKKSNSDIWDLRIGIHTGSVIAGVVGQKKYSYDIWGDTVNTASRMESSGEIGRVNISATTYKLIKDFFQCEFRGKMPVKYKGDIAMFFVNGLNPTYSESDRITPNARFYIQVQLLRLLDLEEFILERLEKELPGNLFFHNVEHTSHVYAQVELLGLGEKVSDEDLLVLRTAALLHDMGYIDRSDDHESRSVEFAREILPLYRYKDEQIERICDLILATRMPPEPRNLLEQIICDANLDHMGRVDFLIQSDKLFQEYRIRNRIRSKKEWNQSQIRFLETHEFYTSVARRMREVPREKQIENIKQFS